MLQAGASSAEEAEDERAEQVPAGEQAQELLRERAGAAHRGRAIRRDGADDEQHAEPEALRRTASRRVDERAEESDGEDQADRGATLPASGTVRLSAAACGRPPLDGARGLREPRAASRRGR